MNKLYLIILLLFLTSCHSEKRKLKQLIHTWQHKEIILPQGFETKVMGKDTTFHWDNSKYKILSYVDTNDCTACQMRLYEWRLLKKALDSLQAEVQLVFVAYQKEYDELEALQQENKADIPFIYDRNDSINRLNHFPTVHMFQTFLLDCGNRVVLVGNPTSNEKLWKLYIEEVPKKQHDEESL